MAGSNLAAWFRQLVELVLVGCAALLVACSVAGAQTSARQYMPLGLKQTTATPTPTPPATSAWQPVRVVSDVADGWVGALSAAPDAVWAITTGRQGAAYRSTDGGRSWQRSVVGTTARLQAIAASSAEVAWAAWDEFGSAPDGTYRGVLHVRRTSDGGVSWPEVLSGERFGSSTQLFAIAAASPTAAWVVGEQLTSYVITDSPVVARTTDGGASWTRQTLPSCGTDFGNNQLGAAAIATTSQDSAWIAASTPSLSGREPRATLCAFRTTDGGATWTKVLDRSYRVHFLVPEVAVSGSHTVWVLDGGGELFATNDDGTTWRSGSPLGSAVTVDVTGLALVDPARAWLAAFDYQTDGPNQGLYETRDGGATWTKTRDGPAYGLVARPGPTGWVATSEGDVLLYREPASR